MLLLREEDSPDEDAVDGELGISGDEGAAEGSLVAPARIRSCLQPSVKVWNSTLGCDSISLSTHASVGGR